jgi:hypothetical protein
MAKNDVLDWSATDANNLDIGGTDIGEGCAPGGINDAIRRTMAQHAASITRHVAKAAGTHTALKTDHNQFWRCTGAVTINLSAAATLTSGWCLRVRANGGAVTIDANLAETIDGVGVLVIPDGQQALIVCDGTGFYTEFVTGQIAGRQTIASAATTDLATLQSSYVQVTGTTTITALGILPAGRVIVLEFAAALTLTHNATSLILPNARNITTAAGDTAVMVSEGSGNWRCISYTSTGNAGLTKVTVFAASGTFTPDARMIDCIAEAWAGGGAGGGAPGTAAGQFSAGCGGQAGAYARGRFTKAQIGASQAVTIAAVAAGNAGAVGNTGGDVSLGSLLVAKGGPGGTTRGPIANTSTAIAHPNSAEVQSTVGDYLGWTSQGFPGLLLPTDGAIGGNGGQNGLGGAGIGFIGGSGAGGAAKANTGAGGGGAAAGASSGATAGGSGGTGVIIITEFLAAA